MNKTQIRVRYEETDQMGVVYHGNYFVWFEIGRTELFRNHGLPYVVLEENQIYLPVIEVNCQYKSGAKYDDLLTISTTITETTGVRIKFAYKLTNEAGEIIALGQSAHAFINKEGRPINIKKLPWLWDKLQGVIMRNISGGFC